MSRGGDGEELGQSLHHSEHEYFQPAHGGDRTRGCVGLPPSSAPCSGDGVGASGLEVSRLGLGTLSGGGHRRRRRHRPAHLVRRGRWDPRGRRPTATATALRQQVLGDVLAASVAREHLVIAGGRRCPGARWADGAARGALLRVWTPHSGASARPPRPLAAPGFDARCRWRRRSPPFQVAVMPARCANAGLVAPVRLALATVAERARSLGSITRRCRRRWEYSLLSLQAEAELLRPPCHGVGLLAWAPLGRGVLTGSTPRAPPPTRAGRLRPGRPTSRRGATSARPASCRPSSPLPTDWGRPHAPSRWHGCATGRRDGRVVGAPTPRSSQHRGRRVGDAPGRNPRRTRHVSTPT